MDNTATVLAIVGGIATIVGCILTILAFARNKTKDNEDEENRLTKAEKDIETLKSISKNKVDNSVENEARLVSIEKDVQYIRISVDGMNAKLDSHEHRIQKLENSVDDKR